MNWPSQIVIVRHAESEGNAKSPDDTSFDNKANHSFALTETGRKQAQKTGEYIRAKYGSFDGYICSTFCRTQETLSLIYPNVVRTIDSRLDEFWRGIWHTMSAEDVAKFYPQEVEIKNREGWYHYRAFGGQNGQDVELMIYSFLTHLREFYAGKKVFIVGHGTWMIFLWRVLCNLSIAEAESKYKINKYKNASVTVFEGEKDQLKLIMDNYVPQSIASKIVPSKKWYEPWVTVQEVEKTAEDLRVFMATDRWYKLINKLKLLRMSVKVYSYEDACSDHDGIYITMDGFVNYYGRPVESSIEVVEGFMSNDFYGAIKEQPEKRHPSEFLPWLDMECTSYGIPK